MPFRIYCLCFAAIIYGVKKSKNSVIFGVIKMFQMDTTGILIKIRKIVRSINIESKKIQKEYGVSIPQVLCLNFLYNSKNYYATQGEIRKFINLNASTVSGIIDRLEAKALVARLPKSGDKRVVTIALTSRGEQLLAKIPSLLQEKLTERLDKLDDKTLEQIINSLELLINLLEIKDLEAFPQNAGDEV
ncbi:MAG: MarR family transcriptional regulator [Prolixibacteraceae bacterium]|nr:MarR family transcriptional regulator [Prolixibacteraceae bacterium]